jgi:hypothetical protein
MEGRAGTHIAPVPHGIGKPGHELASWYATPRGSVIAAGLKRPQANVHVEGAGILEAGGDLAATPPKRRS